MIHIYVCDDSIEFRRIFDQTLTKFIPIYFSKKLEYKIEDSVENGEQLLRRMDTVPLDVVFLDIDLPKMNGFELAKQIIVKNKDALIVFVSGYDHFVYQVFEFFPFAYLRKSHILDELPSVLKRISNKYDSDNRTIIIQSVSGKIKIDTRDIVYICSEGNYYIVYTNKGPLKCRGTLNEAEELLVKFDFYRIHSAYIVNLNHIQKIEQSEVVVSNEKKPLPIAQRRLSGFRNAYSEFTIRSFNL
ncbi:MAG: response regulator transcription factor [Clostridia bacterium]|nr:response regulator transcription factor [Clostridia bacterium]